MKRKVLLKNILGFALSFCAVGGIILLLSIASRSSDSGGTVTEKLTQIDFSPENDGDIIAENGRFRLSVSSLDAAVTLLDKKNDTLFVEEMFKNVPMHPGIFVDIFPFDKIPDNKLLRRIQSEALGFLKCCLMGKEIWMWKHFGTCEIENPTNRGAFSCFLNRVVDLLFSKKAIYRMLVSVQSCFNSRNTRYYNNVMATADHVTVESIRHLQPVKFGPLTVTAPDDLEGFLRYNYPTLHRFTEEEQEKVNNHYPAALSFSTTPKQEL